MNCARKSAIELNREWLRCIGAAGVTVDVCPSDDWATELIERNCNQEKQNQPKDSDPNSITRRK